MFFLSDDAKETLNIAKDNRIKTSMAYISGIDLLKDSLTSFPVINIYQIQALDQTKILDEEAKHLDYYIKSRKEIEHIFKDVE